MYNFKNAFNLQGKTAIVTGGAGILGRYFCNALAAFGANVAVVDVAGEKAEEVACELREKYSISAQGIQCNVSNEGSVREMVQRTVELFGEIHILHNNAATKSSSLEKFFLPFEKYSLETWQEVMDVNLNGVFLVAKEVGARMVEQGMGGSIIQTASIYGILAPDQRIYEGARYLDCQINTPAVYSASKAGVVGLTKYLSTYWAEAGIRVNTLTPGGVFSGQNEVFTKRYSERIPMGRMANPEELTGALIFLASDASSYITGQNIVVDGGLSVW